MKKYESIVTDISSKIRSGLFSPGDPLPSESKIMSRYNVSRITAQKALNTLADMQIVTRVKGSGTFVSRDLPAVAAVQPSRFVTLILPNTVSGSLHILEGASRVFSEAGVNLSVLVSGDTKESESKFLQTALNSGAAGVILYLINSEPTPFLESLIAENYPLVFIDKSLNGVPCTSVASDGFNGSRTVTGKILRKGHKKIGFLGDGNQSIDTVRQRYEGFCSALNEQHLAIRREWCLFLEDEPETALEHLLLSADRPTALFCCNDNTVALLWKVAANLGISIPDDLSVASFDAKEVITNTPFELTSVRQPYEKMGQTAAELVLDKLLRNSTLLQKVYLPVQIVEGNSIRQINTDIKAFSSAV